MYIPHLFIHSSGDGPLDCFHLLAMDKNAAVHIDVHCFVLFFTVLFLNTIVFIFSRESKSFLN